MADDPRSLPARYAYVADVVRKYTLPDEPMEEYTRAAARLSDAQLKEIGAVYAEIDRRGDMWGISEWIEGQGVPTPREFQLFVLFEVLKRTGIEPFAHGDVEYSPPAKRLDWSKLPPDLAYLREPAMKYGVYQFDEDRERLAREITDGELVELFRLAKRVRSPGEEERIVAWWQRHDGETESYLVMWMMCVLNEFVPRQL